jgi:hypothetical protein
VAHGGRGWRPRVEAMTVEVQGEAVATEVLGEATVADEVLREVTTAVELLWEAAAMVEVLREEATLGVAPTTTAWGGGGGWEENEIDTGREEEKRVGGF